MANVRNPQREMKDYVLSYNQKRILKNLSFLKKSGFYLAGGTALAIHLGHRTSQDFDFYTIENFDNIKLIKDFKKIFNKDVKEKTRAKDTLYLKIKQTDLSFFRYPYELIRPAIPYLTVDLASLEDISAMKIESILGRGMKRDFIDIYFLIKHFGLKNLLRLQKEKYPERFNKQEYLKALLYFGDAEKKGQGRSRIYLYSSIDWAEIKRGIEKAVRDYQMGLLKE